MKLLFHSKILYWVNFYKRFSLVGKLLCHDKRKKRFVYRLETNFLYEGNQDNYYITIFLTFE